MTTIMDLSQHLELGPLLDDHMPWLYDTFGRSAFPSLNDARASHHAKLLQGLREAPGVRSIVATVAGNPDTYVGWALGKEGVVLYVYVGYRYRRLGVGTFLMSQVAPETTNLWRFAHWTRAASRMALNGYKCTYDLDAHNALYGQL